VMRPYAQPDSGGVIPDFLAFTGLTVDIPEGRAMQRVNVRQTLLEALALFLQHRLGRGVELREILAGLLEDRSSYLSAQMRSVLAHRFAGGNRRLARLCGFLPEALVIPTAVPFDAVPLEELFSLQTQTMIASHRAEELAAALKPLLEIPNHPKCTRICIGRVC
jgi:hypothetical protein